MKKNIIKIIVIVLILIIIIGLIYTFYPKKDGKKDGKVKAFIKKHKKLSVFIGLILLFALSLGGTILALNITNPPEVDIPKVVGLSKEEAQQEVENAKLVFEVSSEEYNKDVPEGYVISQKAESDLGDFTTTPGDRKVKQGSKILVIISKGQEKTTVPNVEGKERDEALKMLEDAKLEAEIIEETSKTVEEGYVISQETEPDSEAFAGDTVKIHVSTGTGIRQVTVISVIGQDEATAKSNLESLGLKVNVTYQEATSNNGKVTAQSIDANKVVDEGTTITITVNQVAETKTIKVSIDVKKITGGYTASEDEENTESKTVNITVNNERRTGIDKNNSNYSDVTLSGKEGETVTITVTITDPNEGEIYRSSKDVVYGDQDTVTFN